MIESGVLKVVDNQVDQTTGTIKLKAEFPNATFQLWPGQFVNVRLLVNTLKNVVVAPTAAVQRGPNGTFVFVVESDNKVAVRPVTAAQQDETRAVIVRGLQSRRARRDHGLRAAHRRQRGYRDQRRVGCRPTASQPTRSPQRRRGGPDRRERRSGGPSASR